MNCHKIKKTVWSYWGCKSEEQPPEWGPCPSEVIDGISVICNAHGSIQDETKGCKLINNVRTCQCERGCYGGFGPNNPGFDCSNCALKPIDPPVILCKDYTIWKGLKSVSPITDDDIIFLKGFKTTAGDISARPSKGSNYNEDDAATMYYKCLKYNACGVRFGYDWENGSCILPGVPSLNIVPVTSNPEADPDKPGTVLARCNNGSFVGNKDPFTNSIIDCTHTEYQDNEAKCLGTPSCISNGMGKCINDPNACPASFVCQNDPVPQRTWGVTTDLNQIQRSSPSEGNIPMYNNAPIVYDIIDVKGGGIKASLFTSPYGEQKGTIDGHPVCKLMEHTKKCPLEKKYFTCPIDGSIGGPWKYGNFSCTDSSGNQLYPQSKNGCFETVCMGDENSEHYYMNAARLNNPINMQQAKYCDGCDKTTDGSCLPQKFADKLPSYNYPYNWSNNKGLSGGLPFKYVWDTTASKYNITFEATWLPDSNGNGIDTCIPPPISKKDYKSFGNYIPPSNDLIPWRASLQNYYSKVCKDQLNSDGSCPSGLKYITDNNPQDELIYNSSNPEKPIPRLYRQLNAPTIEWIIWHTTNHARPSNPLDKNYRNWQLPWDIYGIVPVKHFAVGIMPEWQFMPACGPCSKNHNNECVAAPLCTVSGTNKYLGFAESYIQIPVNSDTYPPQFCDASPESPDKCNELKPVMPHPTYSIQDNMPAPKGDQLGTMLCQAGYFMDNYPNLSYQGTAGNNPLMTALETYRSAVTYVSYVNQRYGDDFCKLHVWLLPSGSGGGGINITNKSHDSKWNGNPSPSKSFGPNYQNSNYCTISKQIQTEGLKDNEFFYAAEDFAIGINSQIKLLHNLLDYGLKKNPQMFSVSTMKSFSKNYSKWKGNSFNFKEGAPGFPVSGVLAEAETSYIGPNSTSFDCLQKFDFSNMGKDGKPPVDNGKCTCFASSKGPISPYDGAGKYGGVENILSVLNSSWVLYGSIKSPKKYEFLNAINNMKGWSKFQTSEEWKNWKELPNNPLYDQSSTGPNKIPKTQQFNPANNEQDITETSIIPKYGLWTTYSEGASWFTVPEYTSGYEYISKTDPLSTLGNLVMMKANPQTMSSENKPYPALIEISFSWGDNYEFPLQETAVNRWDSIDKKTIVEISCGNHAGQGATKLDPGTSDDAVVTELTALNTPPMCNIDHSSIPDLITPEDWWNWYSDPTKKNDGEHSGLLRSYPYGYNPEASKKADSVATTCVDYTKELCTTSILYKQGLVYWDNKEGKCKSIIPASKDPSQSPDKFIKNDWKCVQIDNNPYCSEVSNNYCMSYTADHAPTGCLTPDSWAIWTASTRSNSGNNPASIAVAGGGGADVMVQGSCGFSGLQKVDPGNNKKYLQSERTGAEGCRTDLSNGNLIGPTDNYIKNFDPNKKENLKTLMIMLDNLALYNGPNWANNQQYGPALALYG